MNGTYELSITPTGVPAGEYKVNIYFFASDDGEHYGPQTEHEDEKTYYGIETALVQTFNVTIINKSSGLIGIENGDTDEERVTENNGRIVSKGTGKNLNDDIGVDMTVNVGDPTASTNVRVELYKRQPTYTNVNDETTYTGTTYSEILDISQYLKETSGDAIEVEDGSTEYVLAPEGTFTPTEGATDIVIRTLEFNKALTNLVETGEYKLVFKLYQGDTLLQTVSKTFIVIP